MSISTTSYITDAELQIDVASLRKTQAHFELEFLSPTDEECDEYPEEALRMSRRALETLSALFNEVQDARNAGEGM
jgi:hypothetical protein